MKPLRLVLVLLALLVLEARCFGPGDPIIPLRHPVPADVHPEWAGREEAKSRAQ